MKFPWKRSVWRNSDQEKNNQNARIYLKTTLLYNKGVYFEKDCSRGY